MSTEFGVDPAEALVRARLEGAVGGLAPDLVGVVGSGLMQGRADVRRRRRVAIAAAAVAVVAVGGLSFAGRDILLGDADRDPTNNPKVVQLEDATAQGMAAAVMEHTADLGAPLAVAGKSTGSGTDNWELSAAVAYTLDDGTQLELDTVATRDLSRWGELSCRHEEDRSFVSVCRSSTLPDGTRSLYLEYTTDQTVSGDGQVLASAVVVRRADQLVAIVETVGGTTSVVLDADDLLEIVTDPAVGLSTTPSLNEAGQQIPDFRHGDLVTRDSGSGSSSGSHRAPAPSTSGTPPTATR
jgi:hypothetical protein